MDKVDMSCSQTCIAAQNTQFVLHIALDIMHYSYHFQIEMSTCNIQGLRVWNIPFLLKE